MRLELLRGLRCESTRFGDTAAAHEFDILISDMGLPDGTGIDLIQTLHQSAGPNHFKAIALSGYGMEEDLRRTEAAGFSDHLTKPADIGKLYQVLQCLPSCEERKSIRVRSYASH